MGEYINGEKNGEGAEFNKEGQLIYNGQYVNGKREGKGNEYLGEKYLIYEGEFLNGERNGKGYEYYRNGNLKFSGQYLYGKIWNGISYSYNRLENYQINNGKGYINEYNFYGK